MDVQFCAHCLTTTRDYATEYMGDGRRFHYCTDLAACAARRGAWNDEAPVYRTCDPLHGVHSDPHTCGLRDPEGVHDVRPPRDHGGLAAVRRVPRQAASGFQLKADAFGSR